MAPRAASYPLLDGRCDEYAALPHDAFAVARGVELDVFQDRDYVWLCVGLPPGDFGAVDLVVATPGLAGPLNLHASAQLGEWPATQPPPADASSSTWGNQRGWSAVTVPFHGTDDAGQVRFSPTPARELQLAKQRFGRGAWRLDLTVHAVSTIGGDARFAHTLAVW